LADRPPPGRPPKRAKGQRQDLRQLLLAGHEDAGSPTACWTAVLSADLIPGRFHLTYHPRYVPHVRDHLGLSDQEAKFGAAAAADEAALLWLAETGPAIVRVAQAKHALILFGDEASFAPGGTLGSRGAL
jgi:hypothetical protein